MSKIERNNLAKKGCFHVNAADGEKTGLNWMCLIVQEDTVISLLTGTGGVNLLSSTYTNASGKTLKAGAFISAPSQDDIFITNITISSGSVIGYVDVGEL